MPFAAILHVLLGVACAVHVTAGSTGFTRINPPACAAA